MAAACISVSLSAPGVLTAAAAVGGKDFHGAGRQAGRMVMAAANTTPSVSSALAGMVGMSISAMVVGSSRSRRNSAIAARAADLEQGVEEAEEFVVGDSPSPPPPPAPSAGTKLYVGNLPWSVTSKQLAEIFQDVGNVEVVEVIYDRETQKSRGFAFVTMSTVELAQEAIEKLDGINLDGRVVKVNFPQPREGFRRTERPPRRDFGGGGGGGGGGGSYGTENKLFVGNLSWGMDDISLESLFQEYGNVKKAEVVYDRATGRSRGFGFVTMSLPSEVHLAISSLDGTEVDKRLLRVNLAGDKPPPREPREY